MLLYKNGDLVVLDSNNLSTLCFRKANQMQPSLWTKPQIDELNYKNRVIEAIQLNQKMLATNFRDQIVKFIDYDKLDITQFLQSLVSGELNEFFNSHQNREENNDKTLAYECSNILESKLMQKVKHMRHHSTFDRADAKTVLSLKAMETDKRVRKNSCVQ